MHNVMDCSASSEQITRCAGGHTAIQA